MTTSTIETVADIADRCDALVIEIDKAQCMADAYRAAHETRRGLRHEWSSPAALKVYRAQLRRIEWLRAELTAASDRITPDDTDLG